MRDFYLHVFNDIIVVLLVLVLEFFHKILDLFREFWKIQPVGGVHCIDAATDVDELIEFKGLIIECFNLLEEHYFVFG